MGLKKVTETVKHARWWVLKLECGHAVERTCRPGVAAPKKVHCEWCEGLFSKGGA